MRRSRAATRSSRSATRTGPRSRTTSDVPRSLLPVPVSAGTGTLLEALSAALDGRGPAGAPLPAGRAASPVVAALRPDEPLEHDDVALVVPTSGSTGEPKGVLLSADALRASAAATHDRLGGPG